MDDLRDSMDAESESPAQKQARLRRERREAKIKAGGSARLDQISQVSGRSAETGTPHPWSCVLRSITSLQYRCRWIAKYILYQQHLHRPNLWRKVPPWTTIPMKWTSLITINFLDHPILMVLPMRRTSASFCVALPSRAQTSNRRTGKKTRWSKCCST